MSDKKTEKLFQKAVSAAIKANGEKKSALGYSPKWKIGDVVGFKGTGNTNIIKAIEGERLVFDSGESVSSKSSYLVKRKNTDKAVDRDVFAAGPRKRRTLGSTIPSRKVHSVTLDFRDGSRERFNLFATTPEEAARLAVLDQQTRIEKKLKNAKGRERRQLEAVKTPYIICIYGSDGKVTSQFKIEDLNLSSHE